MNEKKAILKGTTFHLDNFIGDTDDSLVGKTLLKKKSGALTLFAFDAGQHFPRTPCQDAV